MRSVILLAVAALLVVGAVAWFRGERDDCSGCCACPPPDAQPVENPQPTP